MGYIGQGIAFASLVISTAWLEINDKDTGTLWLVVCIWVLAADWIPKDKDHDN